MLHLRPKRMCQCCENQCLSLRSSSSAMLATVRCLRPSGTKGLSGVEDGMSCRVSGLRKRNGDMELRLPKLFRNPSSLVHPAACVLRACDCMSFKQRKSVVSSTSSSSSSAPHPPHPHGQPRQDVRSGRRPREPLPISRPYFKKDTASGRPPHAATFMLQKSISRFPTPVRVDLLKMRA